MLDQNTLKRLAKGTHDKRADIGSIHVKDTYAEVTNGTMIIREKVSDSPLPEQVIDRKTLKPVEKPFPDVDKVLKSAQEKPTIFKMAFSRSVFASFLQVLPDNVTKIVFEIKGAEHPLVISCDNIEGLLMPMTLEQKGNPQEEPGPAAEKTADKVVKIVIENGEVVSVDGLPEGYKYELVKK